MYFIYFLLWFPLVIIAVINGVVRNGIYRKYMGELLAHQVSTIVGITLFGIFIWLATNKWQIESASQAFLIGVMWLVMTVIFEFTFGHYVFGNPWSKLLNDYNILKGRIWVLVLIWITIAPYIFYKLRS